jgi:putative serine protease PepD
VDRTTAAIEVTQQTAAPPPASAGVVASAAAVIGPSVVTINVASPNGGGGTGSGEVIRADGYILTNDHVVSLDSSTTANQNQISVSLSDGRHLSASLVGTDPSDDLAVVKVSSGALTSATFAQSSSLVVGQVVVAVGAPLGLSNTVTSGIVSALDRPVQTGTDGTSAFSAIQTDAAINPGNSGGPLVDLNGHIVGINAAIASTSSGSGQTVAGNIGIGFAIPSDEATRIANQLISTGTATHAVIGVTVQAPASAQGGGPTSAAGATVVSVVPDGPAGKAGIRAGDAITKVGDQAIDDPVGLTAAVRSYAPGATVPVTYNRNGASQTVQVTLGESSAS